MYRSGPGRKGIGSKMCVMDQAYLDGKRFAHCVLAAKGGQKTSGGGTAMETRIIVLDLETSLAVWIVTFDVLPAKQSTRQIKDIETWTQQTYRHAENHDLTRLHRLHASETLCSIRPPPSLIS